jgi:hypothetical protein
MKNLEIETAKAKKESSKKETTAKKEKAIQVVFGKEIPKTWRAEIRVLLKAIEAFEGDPKVTFKQILNKAIELRQTAAFDLVPFSDLSKKVQTNFENRLAKTLGGTITSAFYKESAQSKFFNFEVQTSNRIKFATPIDPTLNLSPQVKKDNLLDLSEVSVSNLKKNVNRKFERLNQSQIKELERFIAPVEVKGIKEIETVEVAPIEEVEEVEEAVTTN